MQYKHKLNLYLWSVWTQFKLSMGKAKCTCNSVCLKNVRVHQWISWFHFLICVFACWGSLKVHWYLTLSSPHLCAGREGKKERDRERERGMGRESHAFYSAMFAWVSHEKHRCYFHLGLCLSFFSFLPFPPSLYTSFSLLFSYSIPLFFTPPSTHSSHSWECH